MESAVLDDGWSIMTIDQFRALVDDNPRTEFHYKTRQVVGGFTAPWPDDLHLDPPA